MEIECETEYFKCSFKWLYGLDWSVPYRLGVATRKIGTKIELIGFDTFRCDNYGQSIKLNINSEDKHDDADQIEYNYLMGNKECLCFAVTIVLMMFYHVFQDFFENAIAINFVY